METKKGKKQMLEKIISLLTGETELPTKPKPIKLYKKMAPSVVFIQKLSTDGKFSYGSGFVFCESGVIVTCAHVVYQGTGILVEFSDGKVYSATIRNIDEGRDLAYLTLDAIPIDFKVTPVIFRDTKAFKDEFAIGMKVYALGHPFKFKYSWTEGVISQLRPSVTNPFSTVPYIINDAIQTDASLNPGNSGCPVFDNQGRLIGIASMIAGAKTYTGVSFLIPAHRIQEFMDNKPLSEPIYV